MKKTDKKKKRYFISQYDDNWYLINVDKRKQWNEFLNIPEDERWNTPYFAVRLITDISFMTFENPKWEKKDCKI